MLGKRVTKRDWYNMGILPLHTKPGDWLGTPRAHLIISLADVDQRQCSVLLFGMFDLTAWTREVLDIETGSEWLQ